MVNLKNTILLLEHSLRSHFFHIIIAVLTKFLIPFLLTPHLKKISHEKIYKWNIRIEIYTSFINCNSLCDWTTTWPLTIGPQGVGFGFIAMATLYPLHKTKPIIKVTFKLLFTVEYLESWGIFLISSFQYGAEELVQSTRSGRNPKDRKAKK